MELLQGLPMDQGAMARRIDFLTQRATALDDLAHVDESARLGCKGTLLRDAAALALLREDYGQAVDLLQAAGHTWASMGLFAGYKLLRLAGLKEWPMLYEPDLQQIAAVLEWRSDHANERPPRVHGPSLLIASTSTPRQLVDLYLALPQARNDIPLAELLREKLQPALQSSLTATIGNARLSDLLLVIDSVAQGRLETFQRNDLLTLFRHREEWLLAAQADTHHWRRGLNPAGVVDFDLMAIAMLAIESGAANDLDDALSYASPLLALPWAAARGLSRLVGVSPFMRN